MPDYSKIVKEPMWVKLIHSRVGKMHYLSIAEFVADFDLIYQNTVLYNPEDDDENLPEKAIDMLDKVRVLLVVFCSFQLNTP